MELIFTKFLKDPDAPQNYSQLAKAANQNRQVVKGVLYTLAGLGVVKSVYYQKTHKMYCLSLPLNYSQVINSLRQLVPTPVVSKAEWKASVESLIPLVLAQNQIHSYLQLLGDQGTAALSKRLHADYEVGVLGAALPDLIRARLVDLFDELVEYRLTHFDATVVTDVLSYKNLLDVAV